MSDVSPEAAAQMATEGHRAAEGVSDSVPMPDPTAGDGVPPGDSPGGGGVSIVDGLLETNPDNRIERFDSLPDWAAHLMIGVIKFVNGVSTSKDLQSGTPAIVNFAQAAILFATGDNADSDSSTSSTSNGGMGQVDS